MAVNQPQLSTRILSSFSITMRILLPTWSKKLPIFLPTFITVSLPFKSLWPHTLKTTPELTHFCGIEWMWSVDSLQERNIKYPTSVYLPMRWVWVRGLGSLFRGGPPVLTIWKISKHMWKLLFGGKLTETLDNGAKCIKNLDTSYFTNWCQDQNLKWNGCTGLIRSYR